MKKYHEMQWKNSMKCNENLDGTFTQMEDRLKKYPNGTLNWSENGSKIWIQWTSKHNKHVNA